MCEDCTRFLYNKMQCIVLHLDDRLKGVVQNTPELFGLSDHKSK